MTPNVLRGIVGEFEAVLARASDWDAMVAEVARLRERRIESDKYCDTCDAELCIRMHPGEDGMGEEEWYCVFCERDALAAIVQGNNDCIATLRAELAAAKQTIFDRDHTIRELHSFVADKDKEFAARHAAEVEESYRAGWDRGMDFGTDKSGDNVDTCWRAYQAYRAELAAVKSELAEMRTFEESSAFYQDKVEALEKELAAVKAERDELTHDEVWQEREQFLRELTQAGRQVSDLQRENNRLDMELEIAKNERMGETHRANCAMGKSENYKRQLVNNNKVADKRILDMETRFLAELSALRAQHEREIEEALEFVWGQWSKTWASQRNNVLAAYRASRAEAPEEDTP